MVATAVAKEGAAVSMTALSEETESPRNAREARERTIRDGLWWFVRRKALNRPENVRCVPPTAAPYRYLYMYSYRNTLSRYLYSNSESNRSAHIII